MIRKVCALLCLMAFSLSVYAGDAWCKASVTASENTGYCVEGVDGKGKCLVNEVVGASRCSDDQPDDDLGGTPPPAGLHP